MVKERGWFIRIKRGCKVWSFEMKFSKAFQTKLAQLFSLCKNMYAKMKNNVQYHITKENKKQAMFLKNISLTRFKFCFNITISPQKLTTSFFCPWQIFIISKLTPSMGVSTFCLMRSVTMSHSYWTEFVSKLSNKSNRSYKHDV